MMGRGPASSAAALAPSAAASSYAQATDASRAGQSKMRFYLAGKLVPSTFTIFQVQICFQLHLMPLVSDLGLYT